MIENRNPSVLGLKRSFGFGDRLGLATPGHMDAIAGKPFSGIFAQQSIRELNRTKRIPSDVMNAAINAVEQDGWTQPWGADADHLQTQDDAFRMTEAGYTFFTIDPSDYVNNKADTMSSDTLLQTYKGLIANKKLADPNLLDRYMGESFDVTDHNKHTFDDQSNQPPIFGPLSRNFETLSVES